MEGLSAVYIEHVYTDDCTTHTEVEHEQLRDMTLVWGGCPEKMIPDMNV